MFPYQDMVVTQSIIENKNAYPVGVPSNTCRILAHVPDIGDCDGGLLVVLDDILRNWSTTLSRS